MHEHLHRLAAGEAHDLGDRLFPLVVISGVYVEEVRLAAERGDAGDDLLDVRHRLPAIEVDAEDVVAGGSEFERRGLAEAARRAEDQGPTGLTG